MSFPSDAHLDRLSKALRENLRKRKAQIRERLQDQKNVSGDEKQASKTETQANSASPSLQKKDSD
ncbi:MAG: hypothetical protein GY915_04850 [bacterium]|nr:hypothetical protein [bacterium]